MSKYQEIKTKDYCIQELECKCNNCNHKFLENTPLNYEMVCFEDEIGEKYFLPTYGKLGYLDLLEKLVPDWNPNERITKLITQRFEEEISKITPNKVSLLQEIKCPICNNHNILICKRTYIENSPVKWLEINIEKL